MRQAVFLDRDGVINRLVVRDGELSSPREFVDFDMIVGVERILDEFTMSGMLNIIITNQPDVSRNLMKPEELTKMHDLVYQKTTVEDIFVCTHDDIDNCDCRKPKSGMLIRAAEKWNIDLSKSFVIGDSWKDMKAGKEAGCTTILIDHTCCNKYPADFRVNSLSDAKDIIITDSYTERYLEETGCVAEKLYGSKIEINRMIELLVRLREDKGRLFFLGVGGGAGNAGHAVNDFRKLTNIESYTPTDNVSELTARINDDGWETSFTNWLKGSGFRDKDGVFVFSVGGGNVEKNVSTNIVFALKYAKQIGARIFGIVGRDGGYVKKVADVCVIVPTISADTVTAHTESFQSVLWHLIVSHPKIKVSEMKWESIK